MESSPALCRKGTAPLEHQARGNQTHPKQVPTGALLIIEKGFTKLRILVLIKFRKWHLQQQFPDIIPGVVVAEDVVLAVAVEEILGEEKEGRHEFRRLLLVLVRSTLVQQ